MKLSEAQKKALGKMEAEKRYTADRLECSLSTLYALEDRGLVSRIEDRIMPLGWERVTLEWQIIKEIE